MSTTLENKTNILAELWLNYRNDEAFLDFIEYNDLGLPLAYVIDNKIVEVTQRASEFIEETFALLLDGLHLEDTGYDDLDELLDAAGE